MPRLGLSENEDFAERLNLNADIYSLIGVKMILVYKGGLESLAEQLYAKKEQLEGAYVDVFGEETAVKIGEVANRVLVSESFFDSLDDFNAHLEAKQPEGRSNVFLQENSRYAEADEDGLPIEQTIDVAPLFYISQHGVNPLDSPRKPESLLSSFIHNYNKFVWFALQDPPILTLKLVCPYTTPDTLIPYIMDLNNQGLSHEEMARKLVLPIIGYVADDPVNAAAEILDKLVLPSIGIQVRIEERGKPRGITLLGPLPNTGTRIGIPSGGDPFYALNMGDKKVAQNFVDWQTLIGPKGFAPDYLKDSYHEVVDAFNRNVTINKVPITQLTTGSS